jgi:hypothetical protein
MKNGNDYHDQPRESAPKSRNKYQKPQTSTTGNDYQHPPREPVPKSRNNYQKPQTSKTGNDYQHPPRESVPKSRNNYQKPQTSPGNDYQHQHREPALKSRNKYQESQTSTTSQASNKTPLPPVPKPVQKQPPPTPQPVLVSIGANNVVDGAYVLAPWFDNKVRIGVRVKPKIRTETACLKDRLKNRFFINKRPNFLLKCPEFQFLYSTWSHA